jgi:hypothetical protein
VKRIAIAALFLAPSSALADRVSNPIAVFAGLDKITGITTSFEVKVGEEQRFGGLVVQPQSCYSRPVTEEPKTTTFVDVDEVLLDGSKKRIFAGWMFAESPGLNAVEHPVYDVWLTSCRDPNAPPVTIEAPPDTSGLEGEAEEEAED